ncbi:MAG: xanthine dehydrogenase family protein molybdopterin-binding subunit [Dehalococcoidia bacterium]
MAKEYRYVGKPTPRVDAEEIVTGEAEYIDDLNLPDMLYGKVLRSPYPHANILNIETSKAESLPGVRAVLTYKNVPDWKAGFPEHMCVLDSKVRFVGDAVALVAAETEEIADEALELIDVEYEQLPAVYDMEEARKPDAPQLYSQFPGNIAPGGLPFFGPNTLQNIVRGDVEKGFEEADFVAEGTYGYENKPNPLTPEPPGAIVRWEGPDKLTVWTSTQSPYLVKKVIGKALGLPNLRVIASQCGASFGSKNCSTEVIFYAAALAKAVRRGRPVKVVYSKEEHLAAYAVRFSSRINAKVGIKKDGTVTAFSGEWLANPGHSVNATQGEIAVGLGEAQVMLKCDNWNLQPRIVLTNQTGSGIIRGFGGQELKSAFLPILTMAMEKADIDPVEFFKRNYARTGDGYYWRDGEWWTCRGVDYSKAIDKGTETFGWKDKWKGWLKPTAVNGAKRRGVGCGVHGNADVGEDRSEAYVRLLPEGTAVLNVCIAESGGGQRSSLRKMVAELVNLPLDRVEITPKDTLLNPFEHGLAGSRGTYAVGSSVTRAAQDARQKLFERASPLLGVSPDDVDTEDGMLYVKSNPQSRIRWIDAMGGDERIITGLGSFDPDYSMPCFFMIFVEVEVDVETGQTELLIVTGATDVGQVIDPVSLKMQLEGALGSAGLDSALFEETVMDKNTGHVLTGNMVDYKWRTSLELPTFQNVIVETPLPSHIFGAIGAGEVTTSPAPSAVLMAVSNAIGKRVTTYPVTPDKILKAWSER